MIYFVCRREGNSLRILDKYDTEDRALKRLKYHTKKEKCWVEVIPVPEIRVGSRIYREDGTLYGTVTYETTRLWGISGSGDNAMPDPYGKERIDRWILSEGLVVVDEEAIFDEVIRFAGELKERADERMDTFEYLNVEQIELIGT